MHEGVFMHADRKELEDALNELHRALANQVKALLGTAQTLTKKNVLEHVALLSGAAPTRAFSKHISETVRNVASGVTSQVESLQHSTGLGLSPFLGDK